MSELPLETNLARIFLEDVPLIDLRAPVEFKEGAFPTAVSLPLMTDEERARVGTCYKQEGQAAAIALGHQLVGGAVRAARMRAALISLGLLHVETIAVAIDGRHAHAALGADADGRDPPGELLEVARLEVVGAHAVGDLEAQAEPRDLGEQVIEVTLVDVDELVEDVDRGGAQ